eukprot:6476776-Amphidinium_carterae.3
MFSCKSTCCDKPGRVSWSHVPADVHDDIQAYARSFLTTLPCEKLFNECRAKARQDQTSRMGSDLLYHNLANTSTVLRDMGHTPASISSAARASSAPRLAAKVYNKDPEQCSLTDEELQQLSGTNSTWSSIAPHSLKRRSVAWHAIVKSGGDWGVLQRAHLSTLAIPGSTMIKHGTHHMYLVLAVSNYGAVCVRVAYSEGSLKWSETAQIEVVIVDDPRAWKAVFWVPTPVTETHGGTRIVMRPQDMGKSLLTLNALRGFSHMSVAQLRSLAKWLRSSPDG